MFNSFQFNQARYNAQFLESSSSTSSDPVSFNGFGLDNDVMFLEKLVINGPTRQFESYNNPDTHGKTNTLDFFRSNTAILSGYIIKDSLSNLETYIDALLANLSQKEQYLVVNKGHKSRRFKCTWINTEEALPRENFHIEYIPFVFKFLMEDPPFGEDVSLTTASEEGLTTSEVSIDIENGGNAETYLNTILYINTANSLSEIEVENETTGELVTITRSFASGDLVRIVGEVTSENGLKVGKKVYVGSNSVPYDGVIPNLAITTQSGLVTGSNRITIRFTSSSHDVDITLLTRNRYLL